MCWNLPYSESCIWVAHRLWGSSIPNQIFMFVSPSYSASFLWPRMGKESRFLLFFSSLLFMGWRENGGFVWFFSLRSLHASFCWLCMHGHLCTTSTIYVCIYAQWMHTTQGLDSQGLTSCFQLPPQEHSDKGTSASSLAPSRVDFPAPLRNTF